jgi:hypothetical protein
MVLFYKTVEDLLNFILKIFVACPWKKLWSKTLKKKLRISNDPSTGPLVHNQT